MMIMIVLLSLIFTSCLKVEEKDNGSILESPQESLLENTNAVEQVDIDKYIDRYDEESIYTVKIDGNFTNSGYREILAFYQEKKGSIDIAYCFLIDEANNAVIDVFQLWYYGSSEYKDPFTIDDMPMDVLGREIFWNDRRLGFVGDFNQNGKEEIYLYELSGIAFTPMFFEFYDGQFKKLLNYSIRSVALRVESIATENKIINFIGSGGEKQEFISYQWDDDTQQYVVISAEYTL